ncbi:MAG TPA: ShlB/FhaC/HecB family hemolysin secretion/activation protein [Chlamydiales bacterium]|nr:ShlB/FhaC/HecB family hemolysin secretion/activation protein [Chlamydiales bacterium]
MRKFAYLLGKVLFFLLPLAACAPRQKSDEILSLAETPLAEQEQKLDAETPLVASLQEEISTSSETPKGDENSFYLSESLLPQDSFCLLEPPLLPIDSPKEASAPLPVEPIASMEPPQQVEIVSQVEALAESSPPSPPSPPPPAPRGVGREPSPCLEPEVMIRSVLLLGPTVEPSEIGRFPTHGIEERDIVIPDNFSALQEGLQPYLAEPYSEELVGEMGEKIASYYIEDGFAEVLVVPVKEGASQGTASFVIYPYGKDSGVGFKGLVLAACKEKFLNERDLKGMRGLCFSGLSLPGNSDELRKRLADLYIERPVDFELIRKIKNTICKFYEENHEPFVLVLVPEQKVTHRILQIVIIKSRIGDLRVEGNRWFSAKSMERYIKTRSNGELDLLEIQRDLDVLNRNPFRRVNAIYTPGEQFGTTDVILSTADRRPWRVYAGIDDTGVVSTGRERFMTGINLGRVFGRDILLSYQYTTSYDPKHFQAHTGQVILFLPWNHLLNFYGGYSVVEAALPVPSMSNKGENSSISGRYTMPTRAQPLTTQEVSVGFDFKRTNNTILFADLIQNFGPPVNLSQFVGEYRRNWELREITNVHNELILQVYYSPGDLLPDESDARYSDLRSSAKNNWVYAKGSFRCLRKLSNNFSLSIWLRGQYTSNLLLPSEQLGIGGYDTVRGYEERQLSMDEGFIGNLEARSMPFPIITFFRKPSANRDAFQLVAFLDYGFGHNKSLFAGEPQTAYLFSIGPGCRYTYDPWIAVRADYGFRLHHLAALGDDTGRLHFSITASY